jgi:peroxiredoxin/thiol-disulfide isomerase/thioredoxin
VDCGSSSAPRNRAVRVNAVVLAARVVLCAVFAVAGAAKLRDRHGTALTLEEFGLPRRAVPTGALLLPLAELTVAALLMPDVTAVAGAAGASALLGLFIAGIAVNLARGRRPDCNCFGQLHSTPVGAATLARNILLAGLAVIVVAGGQRDAAATALSQLGSLNTATALAASALALALAVLAIQAWLALHLLRRHGMMLLRLDALDGGPALGADGFAPNRFHLPIGAPAPAFELSTAGGETIGLQNLIAGGRSLTLVFVDPGCGPCRELLPELAMRQGEESSARLAVVVSNVDPKATRELLSEHDVPLVLLDAEPSVADAFHVFGTPSAIAIGPDGLIRSEPVAGADAVRDLLGRLDENSGEGFNLATIGVGGANLGLPGLGEPAPDMQLEDLDGAPIALRAATAGRPHLLLFWSPTCGYCEEMLDVVRTMETSDDIPALLLISTGDREANRGQGLRSRTLMDPGFEGSSPALGVTGTPSALRLDAQGRIVSHLAVGADRVLALAGVRREPIAAQR